MAVKPRLTSTRLFIDGGDPAETQAAANLLKKAGFAGPDGQTTNPSLVAKNPAILSRIASGNRLTPDELWEEYRQIVRSLAELVPGDISVEVYADAGTEAPDIVRQARECAAWADGVVIKIPITEQGLIAAAELKTEARLNLTLCFTQAQAAAVYAATRGSAFPVFVSPFVGRLDDRGLNGMQLIENILKMYQSGDGHVHVLAASLRSADHIIAAINLKTPAITLPYEKAFKPWAEEGFPLEAGKRDKQNKGIAIPYEEMDLNADWRSFNIQHDLTDSGLQKFADDWNGLLRSTPSRTLA